MRRSLFTIVTASVLLAGSGLAAAQTTTTTTTWTTDHGTAIREYSTTKKYTSFSDPALTPNVGLVLPGTVTLYPLPETMKVPLADTYSYSRSNCRSGVVLEPRPRSRGGALLCDLGRADNRPGSIKSVPCSRPTGHWEKLDETRAALASTADVQRIRRDAGIRTATPHMTDAAIKAKMEAIADDYDRPARQCGSCSTRGPKKLD
jgi:hypothetical protein